MIKAVDHPVRLQATEGQRLRLRLAQPSAAYLLTPFVPQIGDKYRETAMPGRLFLPDYRSTFRFGAVTLRPGMTMDELGVALRAITADAAA